VKKFIAFFFFIIISVGVLWFTGSIKVPLVDEMIAKIMPTMVPPNLVKIAGSGVSMEKDAADAFTQMQKAAKTNGVILIPRSGYRSISTQQSLWNRFVKLYGSKYTAKVLKPPGESEHQTGYALDVDDGKNLTCSLMRCFKDGPAYKWLTANASKFDFELSYPEGNPEGIAFEPWHWRFIGAAEAVKILKQ